MSKPRTPLSWLDLQKKMQRKMEEDARKKARPINKMILRRLRAKLKKK
jgi:hypothetical protein